MATMSFDVMTGLTISVVFTLVSVVLREQWYVFELMFEEINKINKSTRDF